MSCSVWVSEKRKRRLISAMNSAFCGGVFVPTVGDWVIPVERTVNRSSAV